MKRRLLIAIALVACKGDGRKDKPGAALAMKYLEARNITSEDFTQLTAEVEKALGPVKVKSADTWEWAEVDGDQCWRFVVERPRVAGEAYHSEAKRKDAFAKCKAVADVK